MSRTPTSHILDRSFPLPSDESRFVPHSSIVASSSVMETHFPTTPTARRMTDDDSVDDKHKHKEPTLIEEENGIVGATICFTPQPSPDVSPRVEKKTKVPRRGIHWRIEIGQFHHACRIEFGQSKYYRV
ncbi:hypothetical protein HJC23_003148 [Cyclotella cryptica]|uniref:Uncharacterized protein n=1 Tax=Cyclotella cryptica TaxID=29204 RepID=A0ABD3NJU8_9STRA